MKRVGIAARGGQLSLSIAGLCVLLGLGACDRDASPSPPAEPPEALPGPSAPALFADAESLARSLALVIDPLPEPVRALSLRVYPDRLLLQVQARDHSRVEQYRVKDEQVMGPIAVELTGPGELRDNLFPLQYADLEAISTLVQQAERRAALPGGSVSSVTLRRNLPTSMDIRFQVMVESPQGKRRVEARKDGTILGVHFAP